LENKNILVVGVGGQGTILASNIVTGAAVIEGYDAKKSEIHGMSQRGGSVFSHVRYGDKIYSPVVPAGEAEILLSLEMMEPARWLKFMNRDTVIISADKKISPAMVKEYPEAIVDSLKKEFKNYFLIDSKDLIEDIGNVKMLNVALVGYLSNFVDDISENSWKKSIEKEVPAGTFEHNWEAFVKGKELHK